jgi:hypothetical protein
LQHHPINNYKEILQFITQFVDELEKSDTPKYTLPKLNIETE